MGWVGGVLGDARGVEESSLGCLVSFNLNSLLKSWL